MSGPLSLPLSDIAFIQSFAAFCRTKGDEAYEYSDNANCACAQFLRDSGKVRNPRVNPNEYYDDERALHPLPVGVERAIRCYPRLCRDIAHLLGDDAQFGDRTFSALADRLDALLAHAPMVSK